MERLGRALGYHSMDDWYQVSQRDFERNRGKLFLTH